MKTRTLSKQTRKNFLIDSLLFIGGILSALTGIYFLYFPVGGYQGGRNPTYGIRFIFARDVWDDLHTWFGIVMILSAIIHIIVHWAWIVSMTRRVIQNLAAQGRSFNTRSRNNIFTNLGLAVSFLLTAGSGIVLLFIGGGPRRLPGPEFLFSRTVWDLLHTWAGICLILMAIFHFAIHWGWVMKVTGKMVKTTAGSFGRKLVALPFDHELKGSNN